MTLATPKVVDISNRKPGSEAWLDRAAPRNCFLNEINRLQALKTRTDQFATKVRTEIVKRKTGCKTKSDFALFPTKEMSKVNYVSIYIILHYT